MTEPTEYEPTEYPYHGMSEGFAGDWVEQRAAADEQSGHPDDVMSMPPPADASDASDVPVAPVPPPPPPPPPAPVAPVPAPAVERPVMTELKPEVPSLHVAPPVADSPLPAAAAGTGAAGSAPEAGADSDGDSVGDKLSALLQVAVDEQVSEQRHLVQLMGEVQAALAAPAQPNPTEIRTVVEVAVGSAVLQLSDSFRADLQRVQTQNDAKIADLSQQLAEARSALDEVRPYIIERAAAEQHDEAHDVDDLLDGMAGMRTDLRVLPEQVAPFVARALAPGLADLGRSIGTLEEAQQATAHDLTTLHVEFAELWPRLEQMPAQLAALGSRVASIDVAQTALAAAPPVPAGPDAHEIADIVRKGVRDATRDFVRDYLRDAVRDIVTVSTRDTERRITDHVDEAVLALAQALLTRRSSVGPREYLPAPPMTAAPAAQTRLSDAAARGSDLEPETESLVEYIEASVSRSGQPEPAQQSYVPPPETPAPPAQPVAEPLVSEPRVAEPDPLSYPTAAGSGVPNSGVPDSAGLESAGSESVTFEPGAPYVARPEPGPEPEVPEPEAREPETRGPEVPEPEASEPEGEARKRGLFRRRGRG